VEWVFKAESRQQEQNFHGGDLTLENFGRLCLHDILVVWASI